MKYILPYKAASKSANLLADEMGIDIIGKHVELNRVRPGTVIINWGKGEIGPQYAGVRVINKPEAICRAVNKRTTFDALRNARVPHPEWTTEKRVAGDWLNRGKVCARTTLEGKDGEGLILLKEHKTDWFGRALPLPDAPIYTKFIPARAEYRINVCNDTTVGVQLKVPQGNNPNHDIKTGGNGYGFRLLNENEIPRGIRPVARAAIAALGLDFGGVDLIVGADGNPYILEVNSAPELTPAMVKAYARELGRM